MCGHGKVYVNHSPTRKLSSFYAIRGARTWFWIPGPPAFSACNIEKLGVAPWIEISVLVMLMFTLLAVYMLLNETAYLMLVLPFFHYYSKKRPKKRERPRRGQLWYFGRNTADVRCTNPGEEIIPRLDHFMLNPCDRINIKVDVTPPINYVYICIVLSKYKWEKNWVKLKMK